MTASETPPPLTAIARLRTDVQLAFAMLAGMQLDVFTPLEGHPLTYEEFASAIDVGPVRLRPLLYALVVAGLLTVDGDRFANSPEASHYLVRGKPAYMGSEHELWSARWFAELKTAESIRTGLPAAKMDWSAMSEGDLLAFFRGGAVAATNDGRMLAERYGIGARRSLVDVGGGSGHLAIAVAEACPALRTTVVDLPSVATIAARFVAEAGVAERVSVLAADLTREPLTGSYDVAVLKGFIQTLSADDVRAALRNVAPAIEPGGAIYIMGRVLDDSRLSPIGAVAMNLVFINIFDDGQAYTEQEHQDWLAEAGFVDIVRERLPDGSDMMRAVKPH